MGLIVVEPYKTDLYDHAYRVLRLYLTLAIARVAPILTRIASYWEAYRNLLELLGSIAMKSMKGLRFVGPASVWLL